MIKILDKNELNNLWKNFVDKHDLDPMNAFYKDKIFSFVNSVLDILDSDEILDDTPYDSGNEKDLTCCDCGQRSDEVQWAILVRRKYRSCFGKLYKPYCTGCAIGELEGVHTGGGLTASVIQKVYRIRNIPAFVDEEKREKKHKELKKELKKRKKNKGKR